MNISSGFLFQYYLMSFEIEHVEGAPNSVAYANFSISQKCNFFYTDTRLGCVTQPMIHS